MAAVVCVGKRGGTEMGQQTTLRWGAVLATAGVVQGGAGAQSQHNSLGMGGCGRGCF